MLNQLTLTNFRQFTSKTVDFGPGNTSLRGANEAGKSTVIEGFLYLLGGAKACRNSDFVQWSAKPSSCKVEALMTLQGTQIRATRGKSGAEIYVPHDNPQPTITGQNEVTAWFAEQMGASLDIVSKMCFANQKEIGGLLDEGNSKVVEFIEDMSGLDIVEFFINKIQATGKVGVTTALAERANADRTQLESQAGISYDEAIADCEEAIGPMEFDSGNLSAAIVVDERNLKGYRDELRSVTQYAANLANARTALQRSQDRDSSAASALDEAKAALGASRPESTIDANLEQAQAHQRKSDDVAARRKAKAAADAWPAPENEWDEGLDALKAFIAENREASKDARRRSSSARQRVAVAGSQKTTASVCGLCGKDVSEFPEVKQKNAELDAVIAASIEEDKAQLLAIVDAEENESDGESLLNAPAFKLALTRPDLFEVDHRYVPFRFKWIGGDLPEEGTDYTATIAKLRVEQQSHTKLRIAVSTAENAVQAAQESLGHAKATLAMLKDVTPAETEETISAKIATCEQLLNEKRLRAFKLAEDLGSKRSLLQSLRNSQVTHESLISRLRAALEKTEAELALYEFHNQLVEDLRKARPVVANHLWNMVLKSVSTYLSRMRGEPSIVEREGKTFIVNGRPYTSYSGSALDLLALGIRIALTKVFVPGADMLVLDEPFAACDAARTLQCLSFAAAAGFGQTIVITHEAGTESVFDNIVEV